MHQIILAILYYKEKNGQFPPPYIADKDGKPMHSWRVLILPYIEQKTLYDAYKFDEPWDGPNNRKLHNRVVSLYCCPSSTNPNRTTSDYLAVVGPGTLWDSMRGSLPKNDQLDPAKAIALVEVAGSGIHWMEPRDVDVGQIAFATNPSPGKGISSQHPEGANVALADGTVQFLPNTTQPRFLERLLRPYAEDASSAEE